MKIKQLGEKKYSEGQHLAGPTEHLTELVNLRSTIWDSILLRPSHQGFHQDLQMLFQVREQGVRNTEQTGLQTPSLHQPEQSSFHLVYLLGHRVRLYLKRVLLYLNQQMSENDWPRNVAPEDTSESKYTNQ